MGTAQPAVFSTSVAANYPDVFGPLHRRLWEWATSLTNHSDLSSPPTPQSSIACILYYAQNCCAAGSATLPSFVSFSISFQLRLNNVAALLPRHTMSCRPTASDRAVGERCADNSRQETKPCACCIEFLRRGGVAPEARRAAIRYAPLRDIKVAGAQLARARATISENKPQRNRTRDVAAAARPIVSARL